MSKPKEHLPYGKLTLSVVNDKAYLHHYIATGKFYTAFYPGLKAYSRQKFIKRKIKMPKEAIPAIEAFEYENEY
jgi:hypothetical protein